LVACPSPVRSGDTSADRGSVSSRIKQSSYLYENWDLKAHFKHIRCVAAREFEPCVQWQNEENRPGRVLEKICLSARSAYLLYALTMFPSFDFDVALEYLRLLRMPWLYARLGFLLG
jgi:hypothetical protein